MFVQAINLPTPLPAVRTAPVVKKQNYTIEFINFDYHILLLPYLCDPILNKLNKYFFNQFRKQERIANIHLHFYAQNFKRILYFELKTKDSILSRSELKRSLTKFLIRSHAEVPIRRVELELFIE